MLNTKHCKLKYLICCSNNASFTLAFLSQKDNFFRCKVDSVKHTYLFNFCLSKICKRPEENSGSTISWHLWAMIRHFRAEMAWYAATSDLTSFSFYQDTGKPKDIGFLETLRNPIYKKIILIRQGIIWSLKFKVRTMEEVLVCEITIPTLNKIIKYQLLLILEL